MEASSVLSSAPFDELVGDDVMCLIIEKAPTKVRHRVLMALKHFTKAALLQGVDEEMGVIRLIAAEEELVVAIFEWLKLKAASLPEHDDFIRKYKSHLVKQAFHPVFSQMRFVLGEFVLNGLVVGDVLELRPTLVCHEGRIAIRIDKEHGMPLLYMNPLDVAISREDEREEEIIDALFADFQANVLKQNNMTVRQFVTTRADYRNKLLYAEDGGIPTMEESLTSLTQLVFAPALRDLLWCLAALLTNQPTARTWGLVSQFIGVYRKVLKEAKLV